MNQKIHQRVFLNSFSAIVLAALIGLPANVSAQTKTSKNNAPKTPAAKPSDDAQEAEKLENIKVIADPAEKIDELKKFIAANKKSPLRNVALELLTQTRIELGDEQINYGTPADGYEQFRLAVADAPRPMSDELFDKYVGKLPVSLFFRGERETALELAKQIEAKVAGNATQMSGLANFYLATEDSANALRLVEAAAKLDDTSAKTFETMALAQRIAFRLEDAETSLTRALQINPESITAKRNLADIKRALGKYDESLALYQSFPDAETNNAARTGIVLSLYGAGKTAEANAELNKILAADVPNFNALTGVALFLANGTDARKSLELADRVISNAPRLVWAHIARARALVALGRPLEAERSLLGARQYGNFPTLDYELAKARFAAGFYREAAETLRPTFSVGDGKIRTKLGNRLEVSADDFASLLASESRASVFQNPPAANADDERLKQLLIFSETLENDAPNAEMLSASAVKFAEGDDEFQPHRALFAAKRLIDKNVALPVAEELAQKATKNVERSVDVPMASNAVIADELYAPRREAAARGSYLDSSSVPRSTLSAIMRGRIEETAGWSLYQQGKTAESIVHLRRAVGILPENSTWWRSSLWRLGTALFTENQPEEALEYYIRSYQDDGDTAKRSVIEGIYAKLNGGSLDGLENRLKAVQNLPKGKSGVNSDVRKILTSEKIAVSPTPTATPITNVEAAPATENAPTTTPTEPAPKAETKQESVEQKSVENAVPEEKPVQTTEKTSAGTNGEQVSAVKDSETDSENKSVPPSETVETTTNTPKLVVKYDTFKLPQPKDAAPPTSSKDSVAETTNELPRRQTRIIIGQTPSIERPTVVVESPKLQMEDPTTDEETASSNNPAEITPTAETNANVTTTDKKTDEATQSLARRPRVVVTSNLPVKSARTIAPNPVQRATIRSSGEPTCVVRPSSSELLLSSGGGLATLSVDIEQVAGADQLEAVTDDFQFIEIKKDGNFGKTSSGVRYLFIVKSISDEAGDYKIFLTSPCGKSEVSVKVRQVSQ